MRVVLDTGILIAALITSGTPPDAIYRAWRKKRFELVTSEWQLDEFRRVSRYPKLRTYLKAADAGNLVNWLRRQSTVLYKLPSVDLSPDPNDNPVLAMALEGHADYLVTGDRRDLLGLGTVGSTRILSARQFVDELKISTDG
ncbi:MAG: putative toxin-antitoxin system toxin component, PIN family [Pseudomonadota bacterium]|nr:putative toxin-antitoxin system toxin component, PIN family [Pseudomonadota bacterium]